MHLEVEEMFAMHPARSRAAALREDRRIPGIKSGGACERASAQPLDPPHFANGPLRHSGKAHQMADSPPDPVPGRQSRPGAASSLADFLAAPSPSGAGHCAQGPASAALLRKESPWPAAARRTFQSRFAFAPIVSPNRGHR
jgi:hypothetical protein